jgi:hypothetical protein
MGKTITPAGSIRPKILTNFTAVMLAVMRQVMKIATTTTNH